MAAAPKVDRVFGNISLTEVVNLLAKGCECITAFAGHS